MAWCRAAEREGRPADRAYSSSVSMSSGGRLTLSFTASMLPRYYRGRNRSHQPAGRVVDHGGERAQGGTGSSGGRRVVGGLHRRPPPAGRQHPAGQVLLGAGAQQVGELTEVAAEDDGRDVEDVDH